MELLASVTDRVATTIHIVLNVPYEFDFYYRPVYIELPRNLQVGDDA